MNTFNMRHPSGPECARYAELLPQFRQGTLTRAEERLCAPISPPAATARRNWRPTTGWMPRLHLHGPFRADRGRRR